MAGKIQYGRQHSRLISDSGHRPPEIVGFLVLEQIFFFYRKVGTFHCTWSIWQGFVMVCVRQKHDLSIGVHYFSHTF